MSWSLRQEECVFFILINENLLILCKQSSAITIPKIVERGRNNKHLPFFSISFCSQQVSSQLVSVSFAWDLKHILFYILVLNSSKFPPPAFVLYIKGSLCEHAYSVDAPCLWEKSGIRVCKHASAVSHRWWTDIRNPGSDPITLHGCLYWTTGFVWKQRHETDICQSKKMNEM